VQFLSLQSVAVWRREVSFAFVFLLLTAGPLAAQSVPLAAWSFDEGSGTVVSDATGSGNLADLSNGPAWTPGRHGSALSFDGVDDRVTLRTYNATMNMTSPRTFTLSAWINPRSNSAWQMIVNKPARATHSSPYFDWSLHREKTTGKVVAFLGCEMIQRTSTNSTPLNTWTHVAVTYDGSVLRHYINGALDRTTNVSCAIANTSSQRIRIGANGGGSEVFNGMLDDVRIYGRALSASEIQTDMNTGVGGTTSPAPDTTVPTISITSPGAGATVSGSISIAANAADNVGVAGVQFRLDGVNIGAEDTSAPYSVSWNTANSANGTHTLTAVARDQAGNTASATPVAVNVSNGGGGGGSQPLSVTLAASTSSGTVPVNGVDLSASVGGTATGTLTYTFYCNRSDGGTDVTPSWNAQYSDVSQTSRVATDVCNYSAVGTYTAKVVVQRSSVAAEARVTITVTGTGPPPTVSLSISATPTTVPRDSSSTLTWNSTNSDACNASGAWSGTKSTAGSTSTGPLTAASNTFTLTCTNTAGSASRSASVNVTDGSTQRGLDFQGSASTTGTVRFRFTNPLAIYPATYIWRVKPRQQNGYYTAFFWGNDGPFYWRSGTGPDSYYGAHPYPYPPPDGSVHKWEIAVGGGDFQSSESVVYNVWYTQALRVWSDSSGKHHEFYWNLPDTSKVIKRTEPTSYGNENPYNAALSWGDAPWNESNEVMNGVIRGIQIYSNSLSVQDIQAEANNPLSTGAGASSIWYLNTNPTPTDIADKSGAGHHPEWVGSGRPLLWSGP
jgi:hypothetical protein